MGAGSSRTAPLMAGLRHSGGVRFGLAIVGVSLLLASCGSNDDHPSAAWCSEIEPFVSRGSTQGSIEVVEVTEENAERLAAESAELRSRIAVLVSTAPGNIRDEVDLVLNGSADVGTDVINAAREDVRAYVDGRC